VTPNKPFDHDAHVRLLEEAEHELRRVGKDAMATACGRAAMIHREMESRHATAVRQVDQIRREAAKLESIARTCDEYVISPKAPWIGFDLFPVKSRE
jgi:hypothetical protein